MNHTPFRMRYFLLPRPRKPVFFVALGMLLVNVPPLRTVMEVNLNHFSYVTSYGQWFEEWHFFGSPYQSAVADRFAEDTQHPEESQFPNQPRNAILYRVDAMNPLKFWRWYDYATHPRWQLPYNSRPDTLPVNEHSIETELRLLPTLPKWG